MNPNRRDEEGESQASRRDEIAGTTCVTALVWEILGLGPKIAVANEEVPLENLVAWRKGENRDERGEGDGEGRGDEGMMCVCVCQGSGGGRG